MKPKIKFVRGIKPIDLKGFKWKVQPARQSDQFHSQSQPIPFILHPQFLGERSVE